jgi:hypothetical protein
VANVLACTGHAGAPHVTSKNFVKWKKFSVDNSKRRSAKGLFAAKITKLTGKEMVQEGGEG